MPTKVERVASTACGTIPSSRAGVEELADRADEEPLDNGVPEDQGDAQGLLEGDDETEHQGADHAAHPQRVAGGLVVRRDDPADGPGDEHDGEQGQRLHDDVVHGDAPRVGRAGCRPVVHLLQLIGRHGVLRPRTTRTSPLLRAGRRIRHSRLGVLLEPVEGRVAGHRSSVMVMAVTLTARVIRLDVPGGSRCSRPGRAVESRRRGTLRRDAAGAAPLRPNGPASLAPPTGVEPAPVAILSRLPLPVGPRGRRHCMPWPACGPQPVEGAQARESAIPSRMSCSDVTTSAPGDRSSARESTSDHTRAPAPMTSTRPGCT